MPGDYAVRLHFAETCACATEPGQRMFDIEMEGAAAATMDIVYEAGWRRTHVFQTTAKVVDGALTLELLGIVRNPILSGIEVAGPLAYALQGQGHGPGRQAPKPSDVHVGAGAPELWSAEPPDDTTLLANGQAFELAHVSTGTLHRLDFRFSVAYEANTTVRLFRMDSPHTDGELGVFEARCASRCADDEGCAGIFVRTLKTTHYCNGLRETGHPVGTRSVSRSWKRVARQAQIGAPQRPGDVADADVDAARAWAAKRLVSGALASLVFEGRTASNHQGPRLAFSTMFDRHEYVFSEDLPVPQCIERCVSFPSCRGVVVWIPPEGAAVLSCIGLQHLGTKAGIKTDLNCVSLLVVSEQRASGHT